jgi:hypothetical protein
MYFDIDAKFSIHLAFAILTKEILSSTWAWCRAVTFQILSMAEDMFRDKDLVDSKEKFGAEVGIEIADKLMSVDKLMSEDKLM